MHRRSQEHAPHRQNRILVAAAALAALQLLSTSPLFGCTCPPGSFNYGPPFPDEEIVEIVLDHYGPSGPLVPTPEDYVRASRDASLIRRAIPYLAQATHQPDVPPGYFWMLINDPLDAGLGCLNTFYAAAMSYYFDVPPYSLWIVEFPHLVNLPPMMAIYADLPAVEAAFPDVYGCPAMSCCGSQWAYAPLNDGTWRWQVSSGTPIGPGGAGCYRLHWTIDVSESGVVSQSSDVDGNGIVDVHDLLSVIHAWGPCLGPTGGNCPPDLDGSGVVNVADLLKVIRDWG